MAFVIHPRIQSAVLSVEWARRNGRLHIQKTPTLQTQGFDFCIIGVHGGHGEAIEESLADAAALARKRPRLSELLLIGDWNIAS